jgi:hypothetical protein
VDEELEGVLIAELHDEVARLLRHPRPVGIRGGGDVLDPSRCERDEEQHVDPLQEGGFDGEEVAGKHASRLGSQEGAPRRIAALRRWLKTRFKQHLSHRPRRDRDAQAFELADDASVARVRVLPAEPQDQRAQRRLERRPAGTRMSVRPMPSDTTLPPPTTRERGIRPEIARRQRKNGSGLGRVRSVVERTFAWLHKLQGTPRPLHRRHEIHEACLAFGCCLVCFRRLQNSL